MYPLFLFFIGIFFTTEFKKIVHSIFIMIVIKNIFFNNFTSHFLCLKAKGKFHLYVNSQRENLMCTNMIQSRP